MPLWAAVLASAALVLAAAKAHGRQVRLEREQKGVFHVDFRRGNPAAVETVWRRDRLTFWPAFAVLAVLAGAATVARGVPYWHLAFAATWAFAAAFVLAGLSSWVRMARRKEGPLPWRRRATRGSVGWWAAVAAAAALVALSV
jgi:hypothetical protein